MKQWRVMRSPVGGFCLGYQGNSMRFELFTEATEIFFFAGCIKIM